MLARQDSLNSTYLLVIKWVWWMIHMDILLLLFFLKSQMAGCMYGMGNEKGDMKGIWNK